MSQNKLYMIMLGCKPKGRHTEQHDIFFTIGKSLKEAVPHIKNFWPQGGTIHIDAWREVTCIDGFKISIKKRIITSILKFLNPIEKITENFLMVLLDRSRIDIFETIATKFLVLSYETQKIKIVNITAAFKIDNKEQNDIINALKSSFNANEIQLIITINENILSGIIIQIGSQVIDFSLKSRLKKLAKQLEITNF